MDTPEKTQIGTPLSKFEDSPVFRYINNLSPIKPVKSVPITQTFNSLSFASLPSVFTSPHVSSHRESRFFRKHTSADPSKPESSSEDQNKVESNGGIVEDAGQLYDNSAKLRENFHPGVSIGEASMDSPTEHLKYVIELPQTLKYECGSPDCDTVPCVKETDGVPVSAGTSASIVPFAQEDSERGSSEDGPELQRTCHIEAKSAATGCDWESLISDSSDILIFSSPNDSEAFRGLIQKSVEPPTRFCSPLMSRFSQNDTDWVPKMHTNDIVGSSQQHEDLPEGTAEARQQRENQIQENIGNGNGSKCMDRSLSGKENNELGTCLPYSCEPISNLNRGMRRRCLDFETLAARRKSLGDGFISSSTEKQAMPIKPSGDSSRCVLPGIGLHLNALALTLKDSTNVKPEILPSARQQLGLPSSAASYSSLMIVQEPLHESLSSAPTKSETEPAEEGAQHAEDASQASAYLVSEDINQNSPRKKRRRSEHAGEGEACKRCNCKKSKCLKLYCECFAAGVYCIEPCSCLDCFNKPIHEDTVLATRKQIESRNPLAFAPKVIRNSDSVPETGDDSSKTPASARHKRGCNCKKSSCLKKYCECYQGGVGCSINCRCEGCKNAFGRKDGSVLMGTEVEPEEETETYEKSEMDKALQKSEILNDEEQNANSALPTTPLPLYRPLVQLPFSSKSKPPRSLLAIGSSSGFYNDQKFGEPNILRAQPKFEKSFQTVTEDEMPEILRGNCSPSTRIKTASPNNKRVSPPHCDLGSTPGRRSGRKLILQSIPSFPSLTPQH